MLFAVWGIVPVSTDHANELGMEIRSERTGPNQLTVILEFKTAGKFEEFSPKGKFKDRSRVELRIGDAMTAPMSFTDSSAFA